jgi:hypothetical protein
MQQAQEHGEPAPPAPIWGDSGPRSVGSKSRNEEEANHICFFSSYQYNAILNIDIL